MTREDLDAAVRLELSSISLIFFINADLLLKVRCDWELLKKAPREDIYMISGSNSSCPVCQKSFTCNNELKLHMKTHEERQ